MYVFGLDTFITGKPFRLKLGKVLIFDSVLSVFCTVQILEKRLQEKGQKRMNEFLPGTKKYFSLSISAVCPKFVVPNKNSNQGRKKEYETNNLF